MHPSGYNNHSSFHLKEIRTFRGTRRHKKKLGSSVFVKKSIDVASRRIDIHNVTHVINYDALTNYYDCVHQIGRTGRVGKKGVVLTFVE